MENRRKMSSSGELFSFPSTTPNQDQDSDSEFKFGFYTRTDSSSLDPLRTTPADHLFFKGRLLPHSFPIQPFPTTTRMASAGHGSRGSTSRISSINSKQYSLMSSRSNSTNSRSSTSSSARTSSSDGSERRLLYHHSRIQGCNSNRASKLVTHRCQYITAVPVMKRDVSRRKNGDAKKQGGDDHQEQSVSKERSRGCLRFFRLILLACRECHAMEPSRKQRCGARRF